MTHSADFVLFPCEAKLHRYCGIFRVSSDFLLVLLSLDRDACIVHHGVRTVVEVLCVNSHSSIREGDLHDTVSDLSRPIPLLVFVHNSPSLRHFWDSTMAFISVHCSECVRHVEANVLVLCRCALQTEHGSLPAKSFLSHLYVVHYGPRELFPLCFFPYP